MGESTRKALQTRMVLGGSIIFLISGVIVPIKSGTAQQPSFANRAVDVVAKAHAIAIENLEVVHETRLANLTYRAKVFDKNSEDIYVVNFDPSGNLVSDDEVETFQRAESQKGFVGKIETSLRQQVIANPSSISSIQIWVKTADTPHMDWKKAIIEGRREEALNDAKRFHALKESPVLQFLADRSIQIKYAAKLIPVIIAEVPNSFLSELEALPLVEKIYPDVIPTPHLAISVPEIKADKVWPNGITGSGVKVAIVESGDYINGVYQGSAIASANPSLGAVTYYASSAPDPSPHASAVAGVVASMDVTYKGVSYGLARPNEFLSGNSYDPGGSGVLAATDWAVQQGANVINQSWGVNTNGSYNSSSYAASDDSYVQYYGVTITVSAGNLDFSTCTGPTWVEDPALGYNVIGVGAFNPGPTKSWGDSFMDCYSKYANPISPNGDRQKPEIAAPGDVNTTSDAPDQNGNWTFPFWIGTSFAAPHVAGTAALLMQAKPSLKANPDEVKAVLMASAIHNIEGNTRLSELDGAGGLVAKAAYDAVINGWSGYVDINTPGDIKNCRGVNFNATAGQVVRFVICWPASLSSFNDIDLTISGPTGFIGTSASFDNNFEIMEFTAPASGTYYAKGCFKHFSSPYFLPTFAWAYYLQ